MPLGFKALMAAAMSGAWPPWLGELNSTAGAIVALTISNNHDAITFDGDNLIVNNRSASEVKTHSGVTDTVSSTWSEPGGIDVFGMVYDGDNIILGDSAETIWVMQGNSSTVDSSFSVSGSLTALAGVAFDGTNLITCDGTNDKIYVHAGVSSTVTTSFATPASDIRGITVIDGDLWSIDEETNLLYHHDGISSSVLETFPCPFDFGTDAGMSDLTFDGTNIITLSRSEARAYVHDGKGAYTFPDAPPYLGNGAGKPNTRIALPGSDITAACLTADGENIAYYDGTLDKIITMSGISGSVASSFTYNNANYVFGMVVLNDDLYLLDGAKNVLHMDGFSSTVLSTMNVTSLSTYVRGLATDGRNIILGTTGAADLVGTLNLTRNSLAETFSAPSTNTRQVCWCGDKLVTADSDANKLYVHTGRTVTVEDSFASPKGNDVEGVAFDGVNLITIDNADGYAYVHNGLMPFWPTWFAANNGSQNTSFSTPTATIRGMCFDGANLVTMDDTNFYVHSGVSSTVTSTVAHGLTSPVALTWDGTDLWVLGGTTPKVVSRMTGKTSTVQSTFAAHEYDFSSIVFDGRFVVQAYRRTSPAETGISFYTGAGAVDHTLSLPVGETDTKPAALSYYEGDLLIGDENNDKVWRVDGKSGAVITSFATPAGDVSGLAYVGTNLTSVDITTDKVYVHPGVAVFAG
jgi:hypothetical protein